MDRRWYRPTLVIAAVLAVAATTSLASAGTTARTATDPPTSGTIKIGTAIAPPWVLFNPKTKKYYGPSVTLFNAIGKKLGKKVVYVETGYGTAVAALQARQFDIIGLPLYDTAERKKVIDFALWAKSGNCYVALRSNKKVKGLASLNKPGIKMAVTTGSSIETDFPKRYPKAKAYSIQTVGAGFPIQEVLSGRADITVIDAPLAFKFEKVYKKLRSVPSPAQCLAKPDFPHNIGVAFRKSESAAFKSSIRNLTRQLRPELDKQITQYSAAKYILLPK